MVCELGSPAQSACSHGYQGKKMLKYISDGNGHLGRKRHKSRAILTHLWPPEGNCSPGVHYDLVDRWPDNLREDPHWQWAISPASCSWRSEGVIILLWLRSKRPPKYSIKNYFTYLSLFSWLFYSIHNAVNMKTKKYDKQRPDEAQVFHAGLIKAQ